MREAAAPLRLQCLCSYSLKSKDWSDGEAVAPLLLQHLCCYAINPRIGAIEGSCSPFAPSVPILLSLNSRIGAMGEAVMLLLLQRLCCYAINSRIEDCLEATAPWYH
jgi:hypothetical protein